MTHYRPVRGEISRTVFSLSLPEGRCVGVSLNDMSLAELRQEEVDFPRKEKMCEKTAATFWGGRIAARRALDENVPPILRQENGAPILPDERCGSITHKLPLAAALVSTKYRAVGIDIENARPAKEGLERKILDQEERKAVEKLYNVPARLRPILCFSIKEAIYKAIFKTVGHVTLRDIKVRPHIDGSCAVILPSSRDNHHHQREEERVIVEATWRFVTCASSRYILTTAYLV